MTDRVKIALTKGWQIVPPLEQIRGGQMRVVREGYFLHSETNRVAYVEGQLPAYEKDPDIDEKIRIKKPW